MAKVDIYQHDIVSGLKKYYGKLLYSYNPGDTIKMRLTQLSKHLWKAYRENNSVVLNEINNYHKRYISKSWEEIRKLGFVETDAYDTIAYQYGYSKWDEVPDDEIDISFEMAIDALLRGDQESLNHYFIEDPSLASKKSQYGHEASLIHYVGSNGFELYRQVVPMNLPHLLDYLIKAGCDLKAKMKVYGGAFEMIELLTTSAHPKAAGMLSQLSEVYQSEI